MDKILFARLVTVITNWTGNELTEYQVRELDSLTTPTKLPTSNRPIVPEQSVNDLLDAMQGARLIDAIKAYRAITNADLKEAKDAVEKYRIAKPAS